MRYSTVLKLIAFVLCAAALLGIVGSSAGIVFLTELGGRSVEEAYEDQLRNQSVEFAMSVGGLRISEELGDAPKSFANQYYGWQSQYFDMMRVGYTLCDEAGNILEERELPNSGSSIVFEEEIPVSGQYMKVIETSPHKTPQNDQSNASGENIRILVMPSQEMTEIRTVYLDYTDGSRDEIQDDTVIGWLYQQPGELVFETNRISHIPMGDGWYVNHIVLADMGGNIVYEAYGDTHVIQAMEESTNQLILTLPMGTVTTAAPVGVTYAEGDYTAYDAIPAQGVTVTMMNITYANAEGEAVGSEGISSPDLIGTLFHTADGNVEFRSKEPMTMDVPADCILTHITFADAQDNALFEASCPGGVGIIEYDAENRLIFRGRMPGTVVPEEPLPEEPAPVGRENAKTYVVAGTAVYAAPNFQSQVLETLGDTEVEIIQQRQFLVDENPQDWCLIQQGWLPLEDIMFVSKPGTAAQEETDAAVYRKNYESPSPDAKELGELRPEEEPEILRQDVFYGITWGLIPEGWIILDTVNNAQP